MCNIDRIGALQLPAAIGCRLRALCLNDLFMGRQFTRPKYTAGAYTDSRCYPANHYFEKLASC
jgi:hypothetical protein